MSSSGTAAFGAIPQQAALARLPLQIGTTATWSVGRAAVALFPGLAIVGVAVYVGLAAESFRRSLVAVILLCALPGLLLTAYALMHLHGALRTRASDLLFLADGLIVDGGRLHGQRMAWVELNPPYAEMEDTTARRLTLLRIFLFMLSLGSRSRQVISPVASVRVWRLYLLHRGNRRLIAETDRPIERDSMYAAATSVVAVVQGQRYVAQAPAIAAQIAMCPGCGAPAVPDDAPAVACAYCGQWVPLSPLIRGQAGATKALSQSRATTTEIIAKLRVQPRAARTNTWLLLLALLMFGAWPVGWGLIAFRVLGDGFQAPDALCLMLPLAAVLGGFFIARARLADRGALQLLTLGFGALAPQREGQPSRCRRCHGPLPGAGLGGVTQCRYCAAENIIGLDLRPSVDPARIEQQTFDDALRKRSREKLLWNVLTGVAVVALAGWIGGTALYIADMASDDSPVATPTPAAPPAAPPSPTPHSAPVPPRPAASRPALAPPRKKK
jgi:hypothetical protein